VRDHPSRITKEIWIDGNIEFKILNDDHDKFYKIQLKNNEVWYMLKRAVEL
jgi:hypothetical protein